MAAKSDTQTGTSAGGSGGRKPPGRSTRVSAPGSAAAGGRGALVNDSEFDPSFPFLVSNVDFTDGTAPTYRSGGGDGGGESAGATVSAAIRDVLGYRTRTTDTKGFVAALQRSFTCVEKTGYTVCEWTPRSYAATIPADLGALTGAQASIFERTKILADAIIPLLDGLTALDSAADDEDAEAIRSIVRSRINEIVAELTLEGGPRIQRVDELFARLTGNMPDTIMAGELEKLGERFGMKEDRKFVNTIAEEENFTNFLIIRDSVATMFVTWQEARVFFHRDGAGNVPFLGTQLVLISRQLGVISETVQECYFAMDSVFLGPAERQTVLLSLVVGLDQDGKELRESMLLSELLDWIDRFTIYEGPQLIEEAGTDGVNAFMPTIQRLEALAYSAANDQGTARKPRVGIPPSYYTSRVQLALDQLAAQLQRARELAEAVLDHLGQA